MALPASSPTRAFFFEIARPTAHEFLHRDDRRLGMLAAIVLSHVADYWACEQQGLGSTPTKLQAVRRHLKATCPAFAILHDLADASKHYQLNDPTREKRLKPASRGALIGTFTLNSVAFNQGPSPVMVTDPNGVPIPLAPVIQQVVDVWERELE